MDRRYFNYRFYEAEGIWEEREFWQRWRKIYRNELRWAAPEWTWQKNLFRMTDQNEDDPRIHVQRMQPRFFSAEALPQKRRNRGLSAEPSAGQLQMGPLFEEAVAAGILLRDPRRRDGAGYLGWVHARNSHDALSRFLSAVAESAKRVGLASLLLPTDLASPIHAGVLQDSYDQTAPQYAPFDPPYAAENYAITCRPAGRSRLFTAQSHTFSQREATGPARLKTLRFEQLSKELLPLVQESMGHWSWFPRPDEAEIRYLLAQFSIWKPLGWVAEIDGRAVGYVLAQPDYSEALAASDGGRRIAGRIRLAYARRREPDAGRLLLGGVLPGWRKQGIGRQLWQRLLLEAGRRGWHRVSAGPFPTASEGEGFCLAMGLEPRQSYVLYRYDL